VEPTPVILGRCVEPALHFIHSRAVSQQGKLDDPLKQAIEEAESKARLELPAQIV
jgi:hypothetical protein